MGSTDDRIGNYGGCLVIKEVTQSAKRAALEFKTLDQSQAVAAQKFGQDAAPINTPYRGCR